LDSKKELKLIKAEAKVLIKKDWNVVQNKYDIKLKAGEFLPENFPKHLIASLKTEKVI
jgi:hypothetical protein